jgi:hypothetical protein
MMEGKNVVIERSAGDNLTELAKLLRYFRNLISS